MFKRFITMLTVFVSIIFFSCSTSVALDMKEGFWELTVQMEMPGMPMKMPPQTHKFCLTKDNNVPQSKEPGQECKMLKHSVRGDTVSWVMECRVDKDKVISEGNITYRGNSMTGVVKVKMPDMEMTQKMSGRWLGACPK